MALILLVLILAILLGGLGFLLHALWWIAEPTDLPAWPDVWQDLLFDVPSAAADTALAGAMARALGPIIRDGRKAAPTLPATLVDQMLFASPTGASAIDALLAAIGAWLEHWPAGQALRVADDQAAAGLVGQKAGSNPGNRARTDQNSQKQDREGCSRGEQLQTHGSNPGLAVLFRSP